MATAKAAWARLTSTRSGRRSTWITRIAYRRRRSIGWTRGRSGHYLRNLQGTESPLDSKQQPESRFSGLALLHIPGPYLAALTGFLITQVLTTAVPGGGRSSTVAGQVLGHPFYLPEIFAGLMWEPLVTGSKEANSLS